MFKKKLLTIVMVTIGVTAFAQTVGVNADGNPADPSALLDVRSTDKGMLIPRMNMAARNAIVTPATGLLVFQTDNTPGFYYNSGTPGTPAWTMISAAVQGTQNGVLVGQGVGNASTFSAASLNANEVLATPAAGGPPTWVDPMSLLTTSAVSGSGAVTVSGTGDLVGGTGLTVGVEGTNGGVMYGQGVGINANFTGAAVTANEVLATPVVGSAPTWVNPNTLITKTNIVPGTGSSVMVNNGSNAALGTTPVTVDVQGTQGGVMYGTGTGTAATFTPAGTTGQLLRSNGAAAPTWVTPQAKWTVPCGANSTVTLIQPGSSYFQSINTTSTTTAVPTAGILFATSTAAITSFYQARENCNFTGCTGTILTTTAGAGTYEVYVHKISLGNPTCGGSIIAGSTATSVPLGSCVGINTNGTTGDMGRYNIDLSGSPVALVPGDAIILFIRNTSAVARNHFSLGLATFTSPAQ